LKEISQTSLSKFGFLFVVGSCTGFAAGLFGVGGGIIMVPLLSCIYTQQQALGTSLFAMVLPSFLGSFTHYHLGNVILPLVLPMLIGAGIGSWATARFCTSLKEKHQRWIGATITFLISLQYWLRL